MSDRFQVLPGFAIDAIYHAASVHARMIILLRNGGAVSGAMEEDLRDTYAKLQDIIVGQEYARRKEDATLRIKK